MRDLKNQNQKQKQKQNSKLKYVKSEITFDFQPKIKQKLTIQENVKTGMENGRWKTTTEIGDQQKEQKI